MSRVVLVVGGARAGKSAWAEAEAARSGRRVLYVATATAGDAEMATRIAAHRSARPRSWRTLEEPLDLSAAADAARPGDILLLDCLTLWATNRLLARIGAADVESWPEQSWRELETELVAAAGELLDTLAARAIDAILVSNEVGLGLVPPYPLGRGFRDLLGRVNAAVAARADPVVLMVAGLPVDLRRLRPDVLWE